MKRITGFWKKLTFANQLTLVFITVFLFQLFIVQGLSSYYMGEILEEKIKDSFQHSLQQTALNINTSLKGYKEAINELFRDTDFVMEVAALGKAQGGEEEREIKEKLDGIMKEFMTYRSEVRCMSVKTTSGVSYGYDRMENELLNPIISKLHQSYYDSEIFEDNQGLKGKWTGTEFLDRRGTKKYYVYSYGKQVTDWYVNRQAGTGIVSIQEEVLSEICENAQISQDRNINYLLIADQEGRIVSHQDKDMIGKSVQEIFGDKNAGELDTQNGHYLILKETIPSAQWNLYSVLNESYIYDKLDDIQRIVFIISLLLAVLVVFLVAYVSKKMSKYIKDILHAMNKVQGGKLSAKVGVHEDEKNEISQIATHFNIMMNTVNEQMKMVKESGEREKEAEIRALEAQINPHFVYNTLDSINWLAIENDQKEISNMLSQFAQILRYQIQKSNTIVTIEEELGYLEKYLYLQKVRFMDSFEYVVECQESVKGCKINKMIFQPFIENAILHGVADMEYGGLIKVQIRNVDEQYFTFVVSDNGHGMTQEQIHGIFQERRNPGNSIGVLNVLARLDLYYGDNYEIQVDSQVGRGTVITTRIPKRYQEKGREEEHENSHSGRRDENSEWYPASH